MSNVKPGQRARVVFDKFVACEKNNGVIVHVDGPAPPGAVPPESLPVNSGPLWNVTCLSRPFALYVMLTHGRYKIYKPTGATTWNGTMPDRWLVPLQDDDEEHKDEVLDLELTS